jgi:hypothetical protein
MAELGVAVCAVGLGGDASLERHGSPRGPLESVT